MFRLMVYRTCFLLMLWVLGFQYTAQAQLFVPLPEDLPRWEARISAWPMVQNGINLFTDGKDTLQLYQELAMVYRMPHSEVRLQAGGFYHDLDIVVETSNGPGQLMVKEENYYFKVGYAYDLAPFVKVGVSGFAWYTNSFLHLTGDLIFTSPHTAKSLDFGAQLFLTGVIPVYDRNLYVDLDLFHITNRTKDIQLFAYHPRQADFPYVHPAVTLWVGLP